MDDGSIILEDLKSIKLIEDVTIVRNIYVFSILCCLLHSRSFGHLSSQNVNMIKDGLVNWMKL